MGHHTDKGDIGVAKTHADLTSQGFIVLFPVTEHAPFDLVAYREGQFERIQVDVVSVYCPETDECYYIRPTLHRSSVSLRVKPSQNNQRIGTINAADFRRLQMATAPSLENGSKPSGVNAG